MARVRAQAQRTISADPGSVFAVLADYAGRRRALLTPNFSDYEVVAGGTGAGTEFTYHFAAGGRERDYHMDVSQPAERTLVERDRNSSLVTTWTVIPDPAGSRVTVTTEWEGAGGIGGFFERMFAPAGLRRVLAQMLDRLAAEVGG